MSSGIKKMKVSVIVPIYNVEKYIVKCIESLVNQDFDDYEILLINDGSVDNCLKIIKEYEAKYPSLIKVIDKENGGYGSVLELGIKLAQGAYVLVCDPDDFLSLDALKNLYLNATLYDLDLVVSAKYLFYEDSDEIIYDKSFNADFGVLNDGELFCDDLEFEKLYFVEPSPHGKLYKKALIKDIKFAYKVSYTDNILYFVSLVKAKKIMYLKKAYAYYLINRYGNTRTDLSPKVIDAWISVFKTIMLQVEKASDIFYFRMFEAFVYIFDKVEQINGDITVKTSKYQDLYELLELLIPFKTIILNKNQKYFKENSQLIKLLTKANISLNYQKLYLKKLSGKDKSLKHRLRLFLTKNSSINHIYEHYHNFAKYLRKKNGKVLLNPNVEFKVIDTVGTTFFGYYDKPAMLNQHIIYHKLLKNDLNLHQEIDIYLDGNKISSTLAWNFQQGSMLSFLDDNHIIHNVFKDNQYKAKIININTLKARYIDFPIYSLSKDSSFALSLNFKRLAKLRKDYGYFNIDFFKLEDDDQDGLYYVDLINNQHYLYLSLEDIKKIDFNETMLDAKHKINHIEIAKDNQNAIFLHRWFKDGIKYTRLMLVNIKSKQLKVLAGNTMVSHICFVNNHLLFGYLNASDGDGYYFIDFNGTLKKLNHPLLIDDGHPTCYQERYIVVDTYPNSDVYSKLYLIDTKINEVIELAKFFSPYKYQNFKRCDLHPRFNLDGSITFDSVFSGKRQLCYLNFDKLLNDK